MNHPTPSASPALTARPHAALSDAALMARLDALEFLPTAALTQAERQEYDQLMDEHSDRFGGCF